MDTNWKAHIEKWQTSGLAQTEYCRLEKLNKNAFVYQLQKSRRQKSATQAGLIEIQFQNNFPQPEESPILEFRIDRMFRLRFRLDFRISFRKLL